jgi:predicted ATPase/DNA-binding SARP family transcriptional activator
MLELRLLGPVEALVDDRPVPLGPPQRRALLAVLGLRPGVVVGVDALIAGLWADRAPESAPNIVQGHVARLRSALEPDRDAPPRLLLTRPPGYLLAVPDEQTDVGRFHRLLARARDDRERDPVAAAGTLRAALALWRGEPLADLGDLPIAAGTRDHLDRLRRAALADRVDADLQAGRAAELVAELEALVAADPLAERTYRQLMLALYRAGRPADALAVYGRARRLLADELGLDPGPELRELEAAILRHQVPEPARRPATAGRSGLPSALTSFVGRDHELAELRRLLAERRLVTLTGPGGVGKTRLALELVAGPAGVGPGPAPSEVCLVDLAPVTDPDAVPAAVAAALHVRPEPGRSVPEQLAECLRGARPLILLDNCEHLVEGCADLVDTLLAAAPELRVVATSRQTLGVPGEVVWPVPGLSEAAAVRLFGERSAAPLRPGADTEAAVERVSRRLDGMPLAIELAAARTRMLSVAEIETRLGDRFGLLGPARRGGPARHRTLSAVVDWSYQLLSRPEREMFERLGVFAGSFDLAAAVSVAGPEPVPEPVDAVDILAALVDKSLVTRTEGDDGRSRYRLLDTLRRYARDRLDGRGDTAAVLARHAEHYAALAERLSPLVPDPRPPGWLARLDAERPDLAAAVDWSMRAADGRAAARILAGVWWLWFVHAPVAEGRELLESALGRVPGPDASVRVRLLIGIASFALTGGDLDRAEQVALDCQDIATGSGDDLGVAWGLATRGLVSWARGDHDTSRRRIEQALGLAERTGDRWVVALGLGLCGRLAADRGDHERAEELLIRSGSAAREAGQDQALGFALDLRAQLALSRGRDAEAVTLADQALVAYRRASNREGVGSALRTLGRAALRVGDLPRAVEHYRDRLAGNRRHGYRGSIPACLEDFVDVAAALDQPREAVRLLAAADALRAAQGTPLPAPERAEHQRRLDRLRAEPDFDPTWAEGRALPLPAAFRIAERIADTALG